MNIEEIMNNLCLAALKLGWQCSIDGNIMHCKKASETVTVAVELHEDGFTCTWNEWQMHERHDFNADIAKMWYLNELFHNL